MLQYWHYWRCNVCMTGKKMTHCYSNRYIFGVLQLQPVLVNIRYLVVNHIDQWVIVRKDQARQKGKRVRYVIDRMTMSDVPRVVEIERLAYPSTWPPSAYRKELQDNRWAHYVVLRDKKIFEERMAVPEQEPERHRRFFPLTLLPGRSTSTVSTPGLASIIGFAGLLLMVDEAHITTIA